MIKGHPRPHASQLAVAAAFAFLALLLLPSAATAAGGVYNVVQCYGDAGNRGTDQLVPSDG